MRFLLSGLVLGLFFFPLFAQDAKTPKKDEPPAKKEAPTKTKTQEHKSEEGRFKITYPTQDKINVATQDIPVGDIKSKLHLTGFENDTRAYFVGHNDYPAELVKEEKIDDMLDGVVKGMLKGMNAKEKKTVPVKLGDIKGLEVHFALPDNKAHGKARAFLVGNRLYQVIAIEIEDKAKSIDEFLDSFALLKEEKKDAKKDPKKDASKP